MVGFLLDTHAFIWFFEEDNQLSRLADATIRNGENRIYFSMALLWEIAIKTNIGKLDIKLSVREMADFCIENNVSFLVLSLLHIETYKTLSLHHRDPFDRILVAQAMVHNLTLISKDKQFEHYAIPVLW